MKIKILSDSTCDLSPEQIERLGIGIVPLTVIKDDCEFQDGLTITPSEIFAHVASGGKLCSTAAVNIGAYADIFAPYAEEYDGVLHITIGSGFSSCFQNATLAASQFDNVRVVDSQNLSTGQGLVVLKAVELSKTCNTLDELKEQLDAFTPRVEASFLVDKLDYLVKGGRCSSAAALGANLLNLKPCIEVRDGKMVVVKKYRGHYSKCLSNYVKDRLADRENLDRSTLFVTYTTVEEDCYKAVMDAVEAHGHFDNTYETVAGCTVSCHCGPGTLGVLFVRQ